MGCQTIYDEMMSLQLDGLLDAEDERHLLAHVAGCNKCAPFWDAMREADALLVASSREPAPLPADFAFKVMGRVALTTVARPQLEPEAAAAPVFDMSRPISVLPPMTPAFDDHEAFPQEHLPEYAQEWQSRIASYVRGMTAIGLSVLGAAGFVLALVISGSLQVDGPIAPVVRVVRGFMAAADTWMRSLLSSVNSDAAIGGAFVLALLGLAAWQIVTNYHHSTTQHWLESAAGEAAY